MKLIQTSCIALLLLSLMACSDKEQKAESTSANTSPAVVKDDPRPEPVQQILDIFNVGEQVYVRSLAIDSVAQALWVGTSLGVHEVDLKTRNVVNTFNRDQGLANEYVFGIGIDEDGYKWFGTNAGGMSSYKDGDWKTYFPMHGLADYWIYSFANAKDGGLWVGTWAGANYLNRKTGEFKTYVKELINEWVYGIAVDSKGVVWFGTEGGVSRFDGENWTSWNHEDGMGGDNPDALPFSRNTGLGTRSRHDLGVMASGKATYNPNYVFSMLSDHEDTIWAGTWGGGVARFKDGKWTNLMEKDGLAGNIVYSIAQDKKGAYWFGTNRGLSRYDGKQWNNWNVHSGLPSNDVYDIAIDGSDVWIGTRGGVTRLGMKTEK